MSIDGSGAHRIYQPEPGASDAEVQAALERDPRDWTGAGHLPPDWITALADIDPLAPHGVDISGTWVAFTVAAATDDPAVMCTALRQLRRLVADAPPASRPDVPVIERRLPRQIGSARWHTPGGDVTVIQPGQARHRKPPGRRRFAALGAPLAAVWALIHGKIPFAPLGAAAGIAAVAIVPVIPTTPVAPAAPTPGHTRDAFVPPRILPAATTGPKTRPSKTPRHVRMSAPHQTGAPTTSADSPDQSPTLVTLPSIKVSLPAVSTPTPTVTVPKVTVPPLPKTVKRIVRSTCVTVEVPLLHKTVTTCKKA